MSSSPASPSPERNTVFRPSREHVLAAFVMFLICLMFTGYNVKWFFWVPILPLLFIVWVLRVRTVVGSQGISTRYLLKKSGQMEWENFKSIRFNKAGKGFATSHNDDMMWLPGVSFNSLATLSEATDGRIPDPVTAGRRATQEKVQVVHKDGYAVLMDQDEYADYETKRRAEYESNNTKSGEE
ncbi:PH domain-containing protein [Corynebacterium auriscanis]|uniref:PH domain-containing protein n=1 Tax=Corynebacterium auriscanis TaxID=99807 RepID=UPI003CED10DC